MSASKEFRRQLVGWGLTTAKIWYWHPDAPHVINDNWLLHQLYDLYPEFPELHKYLHAWNRRNEGKVAFVEVAHSRLLKPAELRSTNGVFSLH